MHKANMSNKKNKKKPKKESVERPREREPGT